MATPTKTAEKETAAPATPATKKAATKAPAKQTAAKQTATKKATPAKDAAPKKDSAVSRNAPSRSGGNMAGKAHEGYKLPAGYIMRWAHGSYDLLKLDNAQAVNSTELKRLGLEGTPKWIVTCNLHGTMTAAENAGQGDKLGGNGENGRRTWCPKCRAGAAEAAKATPAKKAPAKKAEATKAPAQKPAPKPGPPAQKRNGNGQTQARKAS